MNVLLTLEAIYDIADISVYIEAAFGQERALQFEVDIEAQFEKLDRYTHSDTGIRYNDHIIYRDVFSPSIIFFVIINHEIHILRVLREEQDWINLLKSKQNYRYL